MAPHACDFIIVSIDWQYGVAPESIIINNAESGYSQSNRKSAKNKNSAKAFGGMCR